MRALSNPSTKEILEERTWLGKIERKKLDLVKFKEKKLDLVKLKEKNSPKWNILNSCRVLWERGYSLLTSLFCLLFWPLVVSSLYKKIIARLVRKRRIGCILHFWISSWLEDREQLRRKQTFVWIAACPVCVRLPRTVFTGLPFSESWNRIPNKLCHSCKTHRYKMFYDCENLKLGIKYISLLSDFSIIYSVRNIIPVETIEWAQEMENVAR